MSCVQEPNAGHSLKNTVHDRRSQRFVYALYYYCCSETSGGDILKQFTCQLFDPILTLYYPTNTSFPVR